MYFRTPPPSLRDTPSKGGIILPCLTPYKGRIVKIFIAFFDVFFTVICMDDYNKQLKNLARANRKAGNLSEALLWNELKQRKMGVQFKRQRPIGNYIADFYCPEKKLVIEIDGWSHDNKYHYDKARDEYMQSLGIHVLRIDDIDVKRDMNNVLIWIKHNIDMI